jgi:hypothetical protein
MCGWKCHTHANLIITAKDARVEIVRNNMTNDFTTLNIRFDLDLLRAIDTALAHFNLDQAKAGAKQLSRVEFIRRIIREYLK